MLPLGAQRYNEGERLLAMGRKELAFEQFRECLVDPTTPQREKDLARSRLPK